MQHHFLHTPCHLPSFEKREITVAVLCMVFAGVPVDEEADDAAHRCDFVEMAGERGFVERATVRAERAPRGGVHTMKRVRCRGESCGGFRRGLGGRSRFHTRPSPVRGST